MYGIGDCFSLKLEYLRGIDGADVGHTRSFCAYLHLQLMGAFLRIRMMYDGGGFIICRMRDI